jgi:hypothetical protein
MQLYVALSLAIYPPRKIEISHFFRSLLSELTSLFPADEETSYVHDPHVYLLHITIQEIKPTIYFPIMDSPKKPKRKK